MVDIPQFRVPITAEDRFDAVFKRFEKRAGETFRETGKLGREAGEKLERAFEPVSKLFGLGGFVGGVGLVGAAEGLSRMAEAGAALGRTSARIGIATDSLHQVGNAAYIAGGAADTGAKALENLGGKLHGAAWGRDAEAIAVFKEFGVAVRTSTGDVRKADEVLPEIADKIKGLKDPYQQAALATALFGDAGRELLPYLRDGREGIDRFNTTVKKYSVESSKAFQDGSRSFEEAQRTMELSARDFGATLARDLFPGLTHATEKSTELLDRLKEMPGVMSAIEIGGGALATLFGVTLVAAIGKFLAAAGGITGAVVTGVGAAGWATDRFIEQKTGRGLPFSGTPFDIGIAARRLWNGVERWLGPDKPGAAGAAAGAWDAGPKQGTRAAPNDALNNWASIRGPGGWEHYGSAGEGVQAVDKLLRGGRSGKMYLGGGNNTLRGIISKWAPGSENDTGLLISRAERMMGITADTPIDPNDRETMRRLVTTMIANEHGGVLPPSLAQGTIDGALGFGGGSVGGSVDQMIALSGGRGTELRRYLADPKGVVARDPDLGKWCAEFVNAYLQHAGVPGTGSLWAPDFAKWGEGVDPTKARKGDVLLNTDRAHVGVSTGRTRVNPQTGAIELEEISSNSLGPNGELLNLPGLRWRSDVEVRRSRELAAAQGIGEPGSGPSYVPGANGEAGNGDTSHEVTLRFVNPPPNMRADVTRADGPATLGLSLGKAMVGP